MGFALRTGAQFCIGYIVLCGVCWVYTSYLFGGPVTDLTYKQLLAGGAYLLSHLISLLP